MMTRTQADIDRDLARLHLCPTGHKCTVYIGREIIACPKCTVTLPRIDALLDERLRLGA